MSDAEDFEFRQRLEAEAAQQPKLPYAQMPTSAPNVYDAGNDSIAPTGSQAAIAMRSPVAGNNFLQNAQLGVGMLDTNALLAGRQMYAQAADTLFPNQPTLSSIIAGGNSRMAALQKEAAEKRRLDAPLASTGGGKVGQIAGTLPLAFVPGVNSYAGAALTGSALGALQPTTEGESRALNTGVGAVTGLAGQKLGNTISSWLTNRAAMPFLGWNQGTGNAAAAQAVGSSARALTQPEIAATTGRLGKIFSAARDPNIAVPLTGQTAQRISTAGTQLNQSSRSALEGNPEISDLMAHLRNGSASAEQLGSISSRLGSEASSQMSSKTGDRALGQALFDVKEHVDDLIGQSITSPELKAAYQAARPEYRTLMTLTGRPTLLNSATGDVNLRNLGNYLQRYDKPGYLRGGNTSPLYEAARFGQASGIGSRPPPPILQPLKWLAYHSLNNPVVGAVGGSISRAGAPFASGIRAGLQGLPLTTPVSLAYLEE